jgi:hypothetical protein
LKHTNRSSLPDLTVIFKKVPKISVFCFKKGFLIKAELTKKKTEEGSAQNIIERKKESTSLREYKS